MRTEKKEINIQIENRQREHRIHAGNRCGSTGCRSGTLPQDRERHFRTIAGEDAGAVREMQDRSYLSGHRRERQ